MTRVPILKLGNILLTAIQFELSDDEAEAFQEDLVRKVHKTNARGLVLDISALDVVDSYLARVLNETATMVRLMGAVSVITGMQPAVAIALTEMGRGLVGVRAALDLEQGLDLARALMAEQDAD